MKPRNLAWLLFAVSFCACNTAIKDPTTPVDETANGDSSMMNYALPEANTNAAVAAPDDLLGYWVGDFEPAALPDDKRLYANELEVWNYTNKINISIDEIRGDSVFGHSVVAGNARPFSGTLTRSNGFALTLAEPGSDKYDGSFAASIAANDTLLRGTWQSFKPIEVSQRKFALVKKTFAYNPNAALDNGAFVDWTKQQKNKLPPDATEEEREFFYDRSYFSTTQQVFDFNASVDTLTTKSVANLTKADLFILRNSIYARHGFSFKNRQLRAFFDRQSWYIPVHTDIKADFTPLEKANIALLLRFEKHAAEYYDEFGRG
jgi:hypothetical protein